MEFDDGRKEGMPDLRGVNFQPKRTDRREFLGKALAWGGLAYACSSMGVNARSHTGEIERTVDTMKGRISMARNTDKLAPGVLIPENERKGDHFLTAIIPDYSLAPIVGGYDYSKALKTEVAPFLDTLESGTRVSILIPGGTSEECRNSLEGKFPGIGFDLYELPFADAGFNFPRDVVFPTGSMDGSKLRLVSSSIDALQFKRMRDVDAVVEENRRMMSPLFDPRKLIDWLKNPIAREEASIAVGMMGDEILSENNPDNFSVSYVPVKAEGGDLQVTRFPDGQVGLIVGKINLSRTIRLMRIAKQDTVDFNMDAVEPDEFSDLMERVKNLYKTHFGVNKVVFLDEPYIRDHIRRKHKILHSAMEGYAFFHSDMLLTTAMDKDGKAVAFCTNSSLGNIKEDEYARRIQTQLQQEGYEVDLLPCGPVPVMNYANSVMNTTAGGTKIVRVPQYGIPQDEEALNVFARRGFTVKPIDMSYIKSLPLRDQALTGSVHCKFVVMS